MKLAVAGEGEGRGVLQASLQVVPDSHMQGAFVCRSIEFCLCASLWVPPRPSTNQLPTLRESRR